MSFTREPTRHPAEVTIPDIKFGAPQQSQQLVVISIIGVLVG